MMLDADIVAVSPSSVWRVLGQAGLLSKWNGKPSKKGTGFEQPLAGHQHWHIDVAYINISGTFYYLCSVLDGCSRYIVNWDLRESMTEADIEIILEEAKERYPEAKPRIISDNGPQFIAKDFKEFIRISGMTHVRTSPYYPQSNGKIERWHKSLKGECIRPGTPLSLEDAWRLVEVYVEHYNNVRLNTAVGYITPKDMLTGRQQEIQAERDRKLEAARRQRQLRRQQAREENRVYRNDSPRPVVFISTLPKITRIEGACRDLAALLSEACRAVGLAARFVSGYERAAAGEGHAYMHAWAEVYVPGGGWRAYDSSRTARWCSRPIQRWRHPFRACTRTVRARKCRRRSRCRLRSEGA